MFGDILIRGGESLRVSEKKKHLDAATATLRLLCGMCVFGFLFPFLLLGIRILEAGVPESIHYQTRTMKESRERLAEISRRHKLPFLSRFCSNQAAGKLEGQF